MQEKYIGDTPDFGKYALLRILNGVPDQTDKLRLGINWYLAISSEVDKPSNNDGNKRHHVSSGDKFRSIDSPLWDRLIKFQNESHHSIHKLETSNVLPDDTLYHSEPLSLSGCSSKDHKLRFRNEWVNRGVDALDAADIVFLDPDNGLSGSVERHHKTGPKFVYYDELEPFIQREQTVVVIQFMGHQKGGVPALVKTVASRVRTNLDYKGNLDGVCFRSGKVILYFILSAEKHHRIIHQRLNRFLEGDARKVFERLAAE